MPGWVCVFARRGSLDAGIEERLLRRLRGWNKST